MGNPEISWAAGLHMPATTTFQLPRIDGEGIVVTGNSTRVDQIPLSDMFHNADSLQESFQVDYKPRYCHSNHVPSPVPGQPDELEKLTIYGEHISAEDPSTEFSVHD